LNLPISSEPFVLVDYTDGNGRPAMVIRRVVRENATHTFNYDVEAGTILQAPMPLAILPSPVGPRGRSLNEQVAESRKFPNLWGNSYLRASLPHLPSYIYKDRKGSLWVYRGPHEDTDRGFPFFLMRFFYKTQAEFDFPSATDGSNDPPAVGSIERYLRPYTNGTDPSGGFDDENQLVAFEPKWPDNAPVLQVGETLTTPKRGLPAVRGQSSVRVLYDQSLANSYPNKNVHRSVVLHDPTRAKSVVFSETSGLSKIPDSVETSDYQGKTYFPGLPPHLSQRLFFDPNLGQLGGLSFIGEFIDDPFGEDRLLLNVLTPEDLEAVLGLCADSDPLKGGWDNTFAVSRVETAASFTQVATYTRVVTGDAPIANVVVTSPDGLIEYTRGEDYFSDLNKGWVIKNPDGAIGATAKISYFKETVPGSREFDTVVDMGVQTFPVTEERHVYDTGYPFVYHLHVKAISAVWTRVGQRWILRDRVTGFYQRGRDYVVRNRPGSPNVHIEWLPNGQMNPASSFEISFIPFGGTTQISTTMETQVEDPNQRGSFNVNPALSYRISSNDLTMIGAYSPPVYESLASQLSVQGISITEDNTPVDSYALTADGGGTGYVVLVSGDSEALTPEAEPVSVHVIRVEERLYRGEMKVAESSNPLDEKVTLEHSGDFAGDPQEFEFQWLTAQPVSGSVPDLFSDSSVAVLPNTGRTWAFQSPAYFFNQSGAYGYIDTDAPWTAPGQLSSNQLVINTGSPTQYIGATALLREAFEWTADIPDELYLSLNIADNDGALVYLNGTRIAQWNSTVFENSVATNAPNAISGQTLPLVFSVDPGSLQKFNTIRVLLNTESDPGVASTFDLRLDGLSQTADIANWQVIPGTVKDDSGTGGIDESEGEIEKMRHIVQGANILTLTDNYYIMRYRALAGTPAAIATGGDPANPGNWSQWSRPQLVEGWIKRALAGINPFEQRVTDLFSNEVNTNVSLLTQAGSRWEGDVALNLENIDDFGLIEIYETILRRGKMLSIDGAPPLNVPAANDALLLAAGYLNDLYMLLGNEAFADAANPTIAFDTEGGDYGEFNTALFAFKGQLASVLDEELVLLRGRDATLQPGVEISPVYNRLVWNFTNGINSGTPIYSLNYNIQDNNVDGASDAADAAVQYPQGHGDAYGHYLTALKGYYGLLHSSRFAWDPRIEAVSVLGQPVSIDYQDERKFATAAAAVGRTASQTLDLTYRKEFTANENAGWQHLRDDDSDRAWGTDEWATRGGQGAYFHWITANSILPETSAKTGIEKIDRTTVPELDEVVAQAEAVQPRQCRQPTKPARSCKRRA
jgi:hypothetical protein